jgi:hypothetical protein
MQTYAKLFLRLLLALPFLGQAQQFEDDFSFEVRKYDIRQKGYPSRIVGDGNGNSVYYEFWEPGSGRSFTGYYLQLLDPDYAEQWFKPVFSKPEFKFEPDELLALDKTLVVTGYQYSPTEKKWVGHANFYDLEGTRKAFLPIDPAALKKFEAGHKSMYAISPDAKRFIRMLYKPEEGSKSAFFVSSVTSEGKLEWASQLKIPFLEEKYKPVKITTDNTGKVWFLMMSESLTGKFETDRNLPPIVVCYNFRDNQFLTWKANVNGVCFPYGNMEVSASGKITLCLAGGDNLGKGFTSGARNAKPFNWSKTYWFTLTGGKEITQEALVSQDIPEPIVERLKTEGADFLGTGKLLREGNQVVWIMESQYTQQKEQGKLDFYGDLLCSGFNEETQKSTGMVCLEKKQRDIAGSVMCSYTTCSSPGKVHVVYLSSVGADGKIISESIDLSTMNSTRTDLLSNEAGDAYFYAEKSGQIAPGKLLLMGLGDTNKQEYRLLRFSFQ